MTHCIWIATIEPEPTPGPAPLAWRDRELLPRLGGAPAVNVTRCYAAFNRPRFAVVASLAAGASDPVRVPDVPASLSVRHAIAECSYEIAQPGVNRPDEQALLYEVRFRVPPDWTDEFDRWYEQEHLAMIYESPYWSMSRRYRFLDVPPGGATHLALHHLNDARGLDAPQLRAARLTPWRNKFLGERWFTDVEKTIYHMQTPEPA